MSRSSNQLRAVARGLLLAAPLALFVACGAPEGAPEGASEGAAPASEDAGARWQMDAHTRAVMAETRASIEGAEPDSVETIRALGATLQEQLDRLIRGCTMTGADHDALHEFLTAYMPAVAALQQVSDPEAGRAQVAALRELLAEYERTFE